MAKRDIGIDLGTANTLVYVKSKGIVINEPSVVAINKDTGEVIAVGAEAKDMLGRTPENVEAIRPLKDGVIADFDVTQVMLKYFIEIAMEKTGFTRPRVVICVPSGVTDVEKMAVEEATIQAGAREAFLIEEPMAAAFGARLPVEEATGSMICDIGGGTSEVAVISLGGIVLSKSLRMAGDEMNEAIVNYIRKEYNVLMDIPAAQKLTREWPTPIVFSGFEVGVDIMVRGCTILNDYQSPEPNIVKESYLAYRGEWALAQPTWDLTSGLFVVRPEEGRDYFTLSEMGTVTVRDDSTTYFTPDPNGKHFCFKTTKMQDVRIEEAFVNLCSEKH